MKELQFNFDNWSLLNLKLGEVSLESQSNFEFDSIVHGYRIRLEDNIVENIFICFNNGYYDYKAFDGSFYKDGSNFRIHRNTTPEEITGLFGVPNDQWDDGVEISRSFVKGKYSLEFVWKIVEGGAELNYMMAELD